MNNKLVKLWEKAGYETTLKDATYIATKKIMCFTRTIKINTENKMIYSFNSTKSQIHVDSPIWVDNALLKLYKKTAKLLKWK